MPLFRGRRPSAAAVVGSVAVAVPLLLVGVAGQGNPVGELHQETGTVWISSPDQGLLSLIDGSSQEVAASLRVAVPVGALDVTQAGAAAYVTDVAAGTVTRVDGATYEATPPFLLGTPGGGTTVLTGGDAVFVVDAAQRTATRLDPTTLRTGETLSLAAQPGPEQAVVDDEGTLWVVDSGGGGLTWVDGSRQGVIAGVDPESVLVLVEGGPAVVDVAHRRVAAVDRGGVGEWGCLDVRPEDQVRALGSHTRPEVYAAVPSTGTVVVAAVGRDDCSRVVSVAEPGTNDFGALAQSGAYLFVPNRTDGTTTVVDTRTDTRLVAFPLTPPGNDVQLVAKDGLVFYNDLDSHVSGVLTFTDGTWVQGPAIDKYDPTTGQPVTVETPTGPGAGSVPGAPALGAPEASAAPTETATPPEPTPEPVKPSAAPTAEASAAPTAPTAAVPKRSDPGAEPGPPPAPGELAVGTLTATPAVLGADGVTRLTAPVANTSGAHWAVTVRAQDCEFTQTTAMAELPDGELFDTPLGPLSSECLGVHSVELVLVGPTGTASSSTTIELVADPASTPDVADLACTPEHPAPDEAITCTASEAVVGSRATWTWSIADTGTGEVVVNPTVRSAAEPFVTTVPSPSRYTVTLRVRYKGSVDEATIEIATSTQVPDVVGVSVDEATATLARAGLGVTTSTEASNVEAGLVLRSDPSAGGSAVVGDTVEVVVSGGPNPPVDLHERAPGASWASGAGDLVFNGSDGDDRGFVIERSAAALEDGSTSLALETHPDWVADGWIEGRYTLDAPILAGDRFRATVGFMAASAGDATFRVGGVLPSGTEVEVYAVSDTSADGVLRAIDVDLSPVAGARTIVLRVDAGATSAQDWAVWLAPTISP
ncbi:PASTA domain-containing protein [Cellulomonas sp. P5_C5]